MIPVLQTRHGLGGNCLAACLASIFEVPLESIPELAPPECFVDWAIQPRLRNSWLAERGLAYLEIDVDRQAFQWTQHAIPPGPCLFAMQSSTPEVRERGYGHYVVGDVRPTEHGRVDYVVLHDPTGKPAVDYKLTAVGFFVPLNVRSGDLARKAARAVSDYLTTGWHHNTRHGQEAMASLIEASVST